MTILAFPHPGSKTPATNTTAEKLPELYLMSYEEKMAELQRLAGRLPHGALSVSIRALRQYLAG